MLYDRSFLKQLDQQRDRIIYVKITALTLDEKPIEFLEGLAQNGSINIDGASAIRRTFQLSMQVESEKMSQRDWGLYTKIKLEIGVNNEVNSNYPKIIWFNQGIYVLTSYSKNTSTSGYSISISGKDKMCLLDGSVGGTLSSTVDFGTYEQEDVTKSADGEKSYKIIKQPIKDIIREAVHSYAKEPFHNIIINDVPDYGLELQEYRYDKPLFLWKQNNKFLSGTIDGNALVKIAGTEESPSLGDLSYKEEFYFDPMNSSFADIVIPTNVMMSGGGDNKYTIAKIDCGETAGYRIIPLTYPDDLILSSGSTLVQMLDLVKNFLGDYEYFYDVNGCFIFQKRQSYETESWNPISSRGYNVYAPKDSQYSYEFTDTSLFTSIGQTPNLLNVKNDFTVWGQKKSVSGDESPIHMRLAIDKRPTTYKTIAVQDAELAKYNEKYQMQLEGQTSITYKASNEGYQINGQEISCDWRELIYRMALDYNKYNHLDDFEQKVAKANPQYPTGITGYEQYYIDMEGFWRTVYKPVDITDASYQVVKTTSKKAVLEDIAAKEKAGSTRQDLVREYEILDYFHDNEQFYHFRQNSEGVGTSFYNDDNVRFCWSRNLFEAPNELLFWFDILEAADDTFNYSVSKLGPRPKVVNEKDVNAIAYLDVPNIVYEVEEEDAKQPPRDLPMTEGYTFMQLGPYKDMFAKSSQGREAKDTINRLLYNHTYYAESLNLTSIPIYYLEPNTRIKINFRDEQGLNGDYIISRISQSLVYNGTMNLTLTKAPPY